MDTVGPLLKAIRQCKFLSVAIDYFTKWVEVEATKFVTEMEVRKFVRKKMIARFGIPKAVVFDNGCQFDTGKLLRKVLDFLLVVKGDPYLQEGIGKMLGKTKQSFNIYKPQVQGVSLSIWGVVHRQLCFQLPEFTQAYQSRQNQRWREVKLTTETKKTSIVTPKVD